MESHVASFSKEVNLWFAKGPLKTNGRLANRGLTSSVKEATGINELTHWGRVTHICVSNLTIIGSDNGLSPGRRQAIICTNAGILLIWSLGANFNEIISEINRKKMHLKMSSGKWRPFCLCLNVLRSHFVSISVTGWQYNRRHSGDNESLYPRFNEVERGVYWYHLVRLSVCPSVDRIVSALYLQQYSSDPFHICTSYQATSEGVSRVMPVSKFKDLKFWRIF